MPRHRERVEIAYQINFTAPFHCGTGMPTGLIDRSVQRDDEGFLVVPGSTIKGAVRERCEDVARRFDLAVSSPHEPQDLNEFRPPTSPIRALFGSRVQSGTLFFDDAKLNQEWRDFFQLDNAPQLAESYRRGQVAERTRVSLSRLTGTARPEALFTSEYGIPGLVFDGRISGVVEDRLLDPETTFAMALLLAGLLAVDRLGGGRSTGGGRCAITNLGVLTDGNARDPARVLEGLDVLGLYAIAADDG